MAFGFGIINILRAQESETLCNKKMKTESCTLRLGEVINPAIPPALVIGNNVNVNLFT